MIKIGITQGDINGVGCEVVLRAFESEEMLELLTPVVYGSPKVITYHKKGMNSTTNFQVVNSAAEVKDGALNIVNIFGDAEHKIEYGKATEEAGAAAFASLQAAVSDLQAGNIDALVCLPMNDAMVKPEDGSAFPGQAAYINAALGEGRKSLSILMSEQVRVAFTTTNIPVADINAQITHDAIAEKVIMLHNTLKRDLFIDNPRIAVLSLNPYFNIADEQSTEAQHIAPVIDELFKRGVRCFGPYSADEFFGTGDYKHFDATLAMYHDQGATPFRLLAAEGGVGYMAGLPFVVTSPAHGTEYAIAGKNQADEQPLRQALYKAIDIVRNRRQFDSERRNPLKKQYFERRDDSDKLKLDTSEN